MPIKKIWNHQLMQRKRNLWQKKPYWNSIPKLPKDDCGLDTQIA